MRLPFKPYSISNDVQNLIYKWENQVPLPLGWLKFRNFNDSLSKSIVFGADDPFIMPCRDVSEAIQSLLS
jgi:hypothetical protein